MHSKIDIADEMAFRNEVLRSQLYEIRETSPLKDFFLIDVIFNGFNINNLVGHYATYAPNNFLED
jgi:hypothetical protein